MNAFEKGMSVLHPGARMSYAVPALLARAGLLRRLYTDITSETRFLKWFGEGIDLFPGFANPIERLRGRRVPTDVNAKCVIQCSSITLAWSILRAKGSEAFHLRIQNDVLRLANRDNFGGADIIYTLFYSEDLVRLARNGGRRVVQEFFITPEKERLCNNERRLYPGVEEVVADDKIDRLLEAQYRTCLDTDLTIVPSAFVADAFRHLGIPENRLAIVPYGVDSRWFEILPRPSVGTVLFVGTVGLRKGVQYLSAAARILKSRGVVCTVRVVGPVSERWRRTPEFSGPAYIGALPRHLVAEEFACADLFVLPSVAEGSATVIYEAMACGLPVITTSNAGSVVRDGVDGYIVPVGSSEAIAERITQLLGDRDLRGSMSKRARERAAEYNWSRYGERLLSALARI